VGFMGGGLVMCVINVDETVDCDVDVDRGEGGLLLCLVFG